MRKIVILTIVSLCALCYHVSAQEELYGIPIDFSRVGYRWGEAAVPDYPVVKEIKAPGPGIDATLIIQTAIDNCPEGGTVLLKAGQYDVADKIVIERSGVILRGEGDGTVLRALGKDKRPLITFGKNTRRVFGKGCPIADKFVPVGQMWVSVKKPQMFKAGDRVVVRFHPNPKYFSEIKMDEIPQNKENNVVQWTPDRYEMAWERIVMKVDGNRLWFDNPLVLEMDQKYALLMTVNHTSWDRIQESGIENIRMVSDFDPSVVDKKGNHVDEEHSDCAISVRAAEHCWIKGVNSYYFANKNTCLENGSKNITVMDCECLEPVSKIMGGRRYAFFISRGELCLVKNCHADKDRHAFVTARITAGPNVYLDCELTNAYAGVGPHQRWATGVLYDCCVMDGLLELQDRHNWGTGHGWAGVNHVLWNCESKTIVCQNPWAHGKNWAVGCVGKKFAGRPYHDGLVRPDGEWHSPGKHVEPRSLYYHQLEKRNEKEIKVYK